MLMKAPQGPLGHLEAHQKATPKKPDLPDLPGQEMLVKAMLAVFALISLGNV
jgi:hypothetical protein